MSRYTIDQFVAATAQKDEARGRFELENPYTLEINLDGRVWCKAGAMIGYVGAIKFTRQGIMEQGIGTLLKKMVSSEGLVLMRMDGAGRVYLADGGGAGEWAAAISSGRLTGVEAAVCTVPADPPGLDAKTKSPMMDDDSHGTWSPLLAALTAMRTCLCICSIGIPGVAR